MSIIPMSMVTDENIDTEQAGEDDLLVMKTQLSQAPPNEANGKPLRVGCPAAAPQRLKKGAERTGLAVTRQQASCWGHQGSSQVVLVDFQWGWPAKCSQKTAHGVQSYSGPSGGNAVASQKLLLSLPSVARWAVKLVKST